MPKAAAGTELRLNMDGSDLPVTVTVPPRVCMGDTITGRVYEGRLHITKMVMGVMGAVMGPQ